MNLTCTSVDHQPYIIQNPHLLRTPRLLIFSDRLQHNLRTMQRLLDNASASFSFASLCPHVKTHKSSYVTKLMMEHGVRFFKATPNEVAMLAAAGAEEIFVAYPLLPADAAALAQLMRSHPLLRLYVQLSKPDHCRILQTAAIAEKIRFSYFIDLDVGMGRTGVAPQQALALYHGLQSSPNLSFIGLHAYDGHVHQANATDRQTESEISMEKLCSVVDQFTQAGIAIPKVVVAGTPSFIHDLHVLGRRTWPFPVYFSPGTWIYFDSHYAAMMPDTFKPAATLLCQIMDQVAENRFVLNMGHKRCAVDQGPLDTFSVPGMKAIAWSEEHTVVEAGTPLRIGDYVMAIPRHVCSTVNLWESFTLMGLQGEVEIAASPIDGRNR